MAKNKVNKTKKIDVKKLKKVKNLKQRVLIYAILMLLFSSVFLFEPQIYKHLNNKDFYGYENTILQDVKIHFADVGQGDSMAIRLPDNKKVLIDAGPEKSNEKLTSYLSNSFFLPNEQKTFDYFIATHSDEDHIGGGVKVFETFQINKLLRPNIYSADEAKKLNEEWGEGYITSKNIATTGVFKDFVKQSEKEPNIEIEIFDFLTLPTIEGEGYSFKFLSPNKKSYNSYNDYSPMILFEYGQIKVLFTGDAEKVVEDEMLSKYSHILKDIDVLKVGHHGSNYSTTKNFVELTKPRYAVIQVGKNNKYKHPTQNTLSNLKSVSANVLRTDLHGNIIVGFSKTDAVYTFVTTNTFLPSAIEVWQVYVSGGVVLFYFVIFFDIKKLKK